MFTFFVLLLIQADFGGPCNISPRRLYLLDNVVKCLRGVPFNASSTEIRNLIPTLKSYFENNPYVDWFRAPPPGYEQYAFDFVAELDEIANKTFADGFDYYNAVTGVFNKFEDGHVLFIAPCLWNYYYYLALDFVVVNGDTEDDFLTPYFYILDGSSTPSVNLTLSRIVSVDFNGGSNFTDVAKAVSDWAVKYGDVGFNKHANWNELLQSGFEANVIFRPPPPNNNITMQIILDGQTEVTTVSIPWAGVYFGSDSVSNLTNLCPVRSSTTLGMDLKPDGEAGAEAEAEALAEKEKDAKERLREIRKKRLAGKRGKEDRKPRNNKEALKMLRKAMPYAFEGSKNINTSQVRRIHHEKMERQRLLQARQAQTQVGKGKGKGQRQEQEQAPAGSRLSVDVQPEANMVRRRKAHARRDISIKGGKEEGRGSFARLGNADSIFPLIEDDANEFNIYIVPERKLGIVQLLTFYPADDPDVFFDEFVQWFDRMSRMDEVENVIIDVRGNGGGYGDLTNAILYYLFPNLRPTDDDTAFVKTPFMDDIQEAIFGYDEEYPDDNIWWKWNTTTRINDFYTPTDSRTYRNLNGTTYTKAYTQHNFYSDDTYEIIKNIDRFSPFDAHHTYVVTDGQCYSACGLFTKLIQDGHAAKLLGYSFNPFYTDPEGLELYNPGTVPEIEFDSQFIDELRQKEYAQYFNNFKNFPPQLPRSDELIGWSLSETYSINYKTRDQLLYFKNNSVDDIIPIFASSDDGSTDNLLTIAAYVDEAYVQSKYCFDWEVQDNSSCSAPSGQVWGNPCTGGSFDTRTCVFSRCEKGLFPSAPNECSVLPYWQGGPGPRRVRGEGEGKRRGK